MPPFRIPVVQRGHASILRGGYGNLGFNATRLTKIPKLRCKVLLLGILSIMNCRYPPLWTPGMSMSTTPEVLHVKTEWLPWALMKAIAHGHQCVRGVAPCLNDNPFFFDFAVIFFRFFFLFFWFWPSWVLLVVIVRLSFFPGNWDNFVAGKATGIFSAPKQCHLRRSTLPVGKCKWMD